MAADDYAVAVLLKRESQSVISQRLIAGLVVDAASEDEAKGRVAAKVLAENPGFSIALMTAARSKPEDPSHGG